MRNAAVLFLLVAILSIGTGFKPKKTIYPSNNYTNREIKNVSKLNAIEASGISDVEYLQKPNNKISVEIQCPDNLIDYLKVMVESGVLKVSLKENIDVKEGPRPRIICSSPELKSVKVSGLASVNLPEQVRFKDFSVTVSGIASFNSSPLVCNDLYAKVSGMGRINIVGLDSRSTDCRVSGMGNLYIQGRTKTANYTASGQGKINTVKLSAEKVDVKASGMGEIISHSSPISSIKTSGMGKVQFLNE